MKALQALPENYREIYSINIQKDKKVAVWINLLAVAIAVIMAVPMHFYVPITAMLDMEYGLGDYFLRLFVLMAGMMVYMILHELVHGAAMKCLGTRKVKYGFTGLYAFAGSDEYYDKRSYILIALAPVIVFAALFAAVNGMVPVRWFWVVYLLQIINISGAAGDLFVTVKFSKMPRDILVRDSGVGMTVYSKS